LSVQSKIYVCDLDVVSLQPCAEAGANGLTVRQLKQHVKWVQNDVSQFGFYPVKRVNNLVLNFSMKRPKRVSQ
jgi:hypothetical protein